MRIPPEKIEQIRDATDIVDYIGGYVKLKRRGKNFVGLCPFHTEKTPSFSVSQERQMYHCFGCGVGGNVFTFVMERDKVSFVEAVRMLAERAGIPLPQSSAEEEDLSNEHEQLYQIMRAAGIYYYEALTASPEGKFALNYFHERGFSDDTIRSFGLGYSPNSWDALLNHLKELKFPLELMVKSGVVRHRDDGKYYDYFRGRAMFPVFSTSGRIIAFGARKLHESDPLGKYINSPETPIYSKSRVLYGISQSKEAIRELENAILVEGYADLISVRQAGIPNIVASSGTALTQEQIQLVKRYAATVTIVYDADSAGSSATMRGVDLILQNDMDVRVAPLPDGDDPDSFIRNRGGEAFRRLIDQAQSFVDFLAEAYERQGRFRTPEGQAHAVRSIVRSIAKMTDELKRNFYIKHVAEKYKLYESTLYRELERHVTSQRGAVRDAPAAGTAARRQTGPESAPAPADPPAAERDLLYAMIEGGKEVVTSAMAQVQLSEFTHPQARALAEAIVRRVQEGKPVDASHLVNDLADGRQRQLVASLLFSRARLGDDADKEGEGAEQPDPMRVAADAMTVLRRRVLQQMIEQNQRRLKEASERGDDIMPMLERHQQLLDEMKQLEPKNV